MTALPYVVIVSDGVSIRTLHRPVFGTDAAELEAIIARAMALPVVARTVPERNDTAAPVHVHAPAKPRPSAAAMMTQREIATAVGYTGNACAGCGSFAMKRSGT